MRDEISKKQFWTVIAISTAIGLSLCVLVMIPTDNLTSLELTENREHAPIIWNDPYDGTKSFDIEVSSEDYANSIIHRGFRQLNQVSYGLWDYTIPDKYVDEVVSYLSDICESRTPSETAITVLSFVQSGIEYITDEEQYGQKEFIAYPLETLYNRAGDCEDSSILAIAILSAMGFDCVFYDFPNHIAIGVALDDYDSTRFDEHKGKKYYFCETTTSYPLGFKGKCSKDGYTILDEEYHPIRGECGKPLIYLRYGWHCVTKLI